MGVGFGSYASPTVLDELKRHLREHGWRVTLRTAFPTRAARPADWQTWRKAKSSPRIPVVHAIAGHKWWRVLQRFTGRWNSCPRPSTPSPDRNPG
jgi:hypothetical protein